MWWCWYSQSDCHSDSDSCAPEVMVPDARVFSSMQNEQKYIFPIHIIYALIFPNIRDPDPRYKWVGKSLTSNKHVGFKGICNKQVGFKALVISKSFSSFLIGCVRRPTLRTDKGSSSITDNMITFNGISVLNFKFKRYSL